MNDYEILILSLAVPAFGLALDMWGDRHQNNVYRRVTIVQWFAVFLSIYIGVRIAVNVPPFSQHLPLATGVIAGGSTAAGAKIGLKVGKHLDKRAREQAANAARKKAMLNG